MNATSIELFPHPRMKAAISAPRYSCFISPFSDRGMARSRRFFGLLLIGVGLCTPVVAGDQIWISEQACGSDSGVDSANAHSAAWFNTAANWGGGATDIDPGDVVVLTGSIATPLTFQGSGRADAPITLKFDTGARLSRPSWTSSGALVANGKNYVAVEGGIVESTANGVGLAYTNNDRHISLTACKNWTLSGVTSRNVYVPSVGGSNAYGNALYALNCSGLTVSNCLFTTGGKIVFVGYGLGNSNVVVVGNMVSNCIVGITVGSAGTGATLSGLTIRGNTIANGTNWGGSWAGGTVWHHIDGIHAYAAHASTLISNAVIDGNRIGPYNPTYVSGGSTKSTATAWIYVEANVGEIYAPVVKNNVLIVGPGIGQGPMVGILAVKNGTAPVVCNNTMLGSGTANGVYLYNTTSDALVQNNIFRNLGLGIYDDSSTPRPRFYSNNYYQNMAVGRIATTSYASLSQWQTALGGALVDGNDRNSLSADPLFVDASVGNCHLTSGSPCIDVGTAVFANDRDCEGLFRPHGIAWDIGAYEFGATMVPLPPPPSKVPAAPSAPRIFQSP